MARPLSSEKKPHMQALKSASQSMQTARRLLSFLLAFATTAFCANAQTQIQTSAQALTQMSTQTQTLGEDYIVDDKVLIKTPDGAHISAIVVRKKTTNKPLPTVLQMTIYVRDRDLQSLKEAADHGYVGVMAYSRGKFLSPDLIAPYEHEASDTYTVIDWISKQSWSNAAVGMYGGSYNGFTQWAATKRLHPALKTIVPYVANRPGQGLPMENNIFINPNYQWAFYVSNNKTLDNAVNDDRKRFRDLAFNWWQSGRKYRDIDQVDGTPNPLLQRWLQHPAYDHYWQTMVPVGEEFAHINIPVLSIDGYYNDSQVSGLNYLREHLRYSPNAEHYLIIGPYGHFGAQRGGEKILNDLEISPDALIDTKKITYEWLDYILKNAAKPTFLKDKINYFVMDENQWHHAPSLDAMHNDHLKFYLSTAAAKNNYALSTQAPKKINYLQQVVDFSDRKISNNDYYPSPIVRDDVDRSNGFVFISEALTADVTMNGSFDGAIVASINLRDMDYGVTLYELTEDGKYFHLSYVITRASYAQGQSERQLLQPNRITTLPIPTTRMISKRLKKGSRIVAYLNINKNPFSQLNYGSGKDVSDESIADAKTPLKVRWYNQSFIRIPVQR